MKKRIISIILICMLSINVFIFSYTTSYAIGMEGALVLTGIDLAFLTGVGEVVVVAGLVGVAGYKTYQLLSTFDYSRLNTAWNNLTSSQRSKIHQKALESKDEKVIKLTKDEFSDYGLNQVFNSYQNFLKGQKQLEDLKKIYYTDGSSNIAKYIDYNVQMQDNAINYIQNVKPYDMDIESIITYSSVALGIRETKGPQGKFFLISGNSQNGVIRTKIDYRFLNRETGKYLVGVIFRYSANVLGKNLEWYSDSSQDKNYKGMRLYTSNYSATGLQFSDRHLSNNLANFFNLDSCNFEDMQNIFAYTGNGSICYSPPIIDTPSISIPDVINVPMDNALEGQDQPDARPFSIPQVRPDVLTNNPALDQAITNGEIIVDDSFPVTGDGTTPIDPTIPVNPSLDLSIPQNATLDFSPLILAGTTLKGKFPFSIPWDMANSIKALNVMGVAPKFTIPLSKTPLVGGTDVVIDFGIFEQWAKIIRWGTLISFTLSLIILTRRFVGGAS